jgi:hypothetical protein
MDWKKISIGSKKPKREIDVTVTPKHIFFGLVILFVIVYGITNFLITNGYYEIEDMKIECGTGKIEEIEKDKQFYCGEHYSVLKDYVSEKNYKHLEGIINGENS